MNGPEGEETIFTEALRLPPTERSDYLARVTAGNPVLRQEVESLLQGHAAGEFLEVAPASERRSAVQVTAPLTEKPGDTIGRYKLLQKIGEGGCGIVYMAEQTEPVRRRVALKIIKLGLDTESVIARFEAERQALALMDHPNIAKVFDAGASEMGRPYFVMELVHGLKITDFCDEQKLPTKQRLELFVHVCQAVQHAHQKGIIHRDIKPSNVLVSINDGVAVPKIIDFGIAKATSGQLLTNKTVFTAFEQFIGTPAYMSPEQAMITNVDVDTRSDIYSLGVLLYELLTGKTPFETQDLLAVGLDEMRRAIREREPQRPSTRLSTLPGEELSTAAQRRGLDVPKLVSELRGDLDWIVMKAMEKDRARRYDTANGLAADIQCYLNHEPVLACPPTRLYRLGKTVRRNRLAFATAATMAMTLVIGSVVSVWQARRAQRAEESANAAAADAQRSEKAAKAEKDSSEAVLQFVRDKILSAGRPEDVGGGLGKTVTLRQAIDSAETNIAKAFQERPLVEAALRKTLGESYLDLGEPLLAIPQLERALAVRRQRLGLEDEHTVGTMTKLRRAYHEAGKPFEFVSFYEEALKQTQARMGPEHADTIGRMNDLAIAYIDAGRFSDAVALQEKSLKLSKANRGPRQGDTLVLMHNLAVAYQEAEKPEQALPLLAEAFQLTKRQRGSEARETLRQMQSLAVAYAEASEFDQALPLFAETLELVKTRLGPAAPETLDVMNDFGMVCQRAGKPEQALPLLEEVLKLETEKRGAEHRETLNVVNNLALVYRGLGKFDQAISLLEEKLRLSEGKQGADHPDTLRSMNDLACTYRDAGKLEQALPLLEETLKRRTAQLGPDHRDTLDSLAELVLAYERANRPEQGIPLGEKGVELSAARHGLERRPTRKLIHHLGIAYEAAGKQDKAVPLIYQPDGDSAAPSLTMLYSGKQVMSFYRSGIGTLEETDDLTTAHWLRVPLQDNPQILSITGARKFYRVRGE